MRAFFALLLFAAAPAFATVFTSEAVPGYCLDVNMMNHSVALWNCHGGANQDLQFQGYGTVKNANLCLDTAPKAEGNALILAACNNSQGQRWGYDRASHQLRNEQGWCADTKAGGRTRGTPIIAWKCGAQANQKWRDGKVVALSALPTLGLNPIQQQQLQKADAKINVAGGDIAAPSGGGIVAAGGGNIVAAGGGNIVAAGGGNLVVLNR